MVLPSKNFKVKVGPFFYLVRYSKEIAEEGQSFGSTHNNNQWIFLDPDKSKEKIEHTFLHELIHACMFVNGLTYRFDKKDLDKRPSEEDVVRELSMTLYQVIKDNPRIFNGRKRK